MTTPQHTPHSNTLRNECTKHFERTVLGWRIVNVVFSPNRYPKSELTPLILVILLFVLLHFYVGRWKSTDNANLIWIRVLQLIELPTTTFRCHGSLGSVPFDTDTLGWSSIWCVEFGCQAIFRDCLRQIRPSPISEGLLFDKISFQSLRSFVAEITPFSTIMENATCSSEK